MPSKDNGLSSGALIAGIGVGVLLGYAIGAASSIFLLPKSQALFPAADPKVEQSYRRAGFGDLLMTLERRQAFADCYKKFLEGRTQPSVALPQEGRLVYVFHLAEDGKLNGFELAVDELKDKSLVQCVEQQFKGLRFLPPPLGINRYISHELAFKKEETYLKEQESRKNKPALELVVPSATPPSQSPGSESPEK